MVAVLIGMYSKCREENGLTVLVNTSSCSMDVMHGALRAGMMETDWQIQKGIHAIWKIVDESPARRDIYLQETGCAVFPLHFCNTLLIQDELVAG